MVITDAVKSIIGEAAQRPRQRYDFPGMRAFSLALYPNRYNDPRRLTFLRVFAQMHHLFRFGRAV